MPVPKIVVTAALMAANMALTMTRKTEGPRLDDLKFTQGDYGAPLAREWGTRRLQANIFWAEDLTEVKRQRKTKGGKFNEYTYYGTWAVALAGHEIDAVRRIWFDTHLVYDVTGAGPVMPFDFGDSSIVQQAAGVGTGGFSPSDNIAIYLGTSTQTADPRMEATVEAEFGEGSCPAYRDTAYIVFKDVPLEKIGNRIPQVSVELVTNAATLYPSEVFDSDVTQPHRLQGATFSPDYSRFMWAFTDEYAVWDVASRTQIASGLLPATINSPTKLGVYDDGDILAVSSDNGSLLSFSADFISYSTVGSFGFDQEEVRVVKDGNGVEHWLTIPWSAGREFYVDTLDTVYRMDELTGEDWQPLDWFADQHGDIWAVGRGVGTSHTELHFYRMIETSGRGGANLITASGLPSPANSLGNIGAIHYFDGDNDHFVAHWEAGGLYVIDINDGSIITSSTPPMNVYNTDSQFANCPPGAATIWLDEIEVSLADLSIVRTVVRTNWTPDSWDGVIYDPVNHALISAPQFDQEIRWNYLDRVGSNDVLLSTIVGDVAQLVGITDYDFSDLDQSVYGWSVTRGPADNMVEPLLDAYDADIRPHDFKIEGVKRRGVAGGALKTERFVGAPRYTVALKQELPRSLTFTFADKDADQQPNTTVSDRPLDATGARGEASIDLGTLALDADEARDLGDRYFRRMWNGRKTVSNGLTAQQLGLEPGDVRTLELDGIEAVYRLTRLVAKADDSLETEWEYDHPSLAVLNGGTGASFDGRNPSQIVVPLPSKGFVLDTPLLTDADNSPNPLLYVAAGPYAAGTWPGAVVFQSVDGEYSDELDSVPSSAAATWGYTNDALADASPWLWDRGNEVNVTLQVGELTGATEAALLADPTLNLALIGDELVQFSSATLEADGTYTLSGFRRGRRGTEWAMGGHAARDTFLLLDSADPNVAGLSEVGTGLSFKTITSGRTDGFVTDVAFTGASLKPYAPVHLEAVKQSNGDWTFSWVRRTRVGGAWTSGTTIPLSEASEQYEITVGDGTSSDTKTVTIASYTWTLAQQTTDTGAEVLEADLEWSVVQMSDAVGAGFVATA